MINENVCLVVRISIFILTLAGISYCSPHTDIFKEKLFIKPLPSGHIYTHFQFVVQKENIHNDANDFVHFQLFPRSVGEILSQHSLQELHFSLTQGLWRHEKWGYPIRSSPPGAELWALFKGNISEIPSNWQKLTHVMSGQFCASLNFIENSNTVVPLLSFRPEGVLSSPFNTSFLRYSSLPPEIVCTENLTPFRKLLPCAFQAGLSTLLNALDIFKAQYMSLAVDVQTVCKDSSCRKSSTELVQTVSMVFEIPGAHVDYPAWSFVKLFGSSLSSICPMASESKVFADVSENKTGSQFTLTIPSVETAEELIGLKSTPYVVYDLKKIFEERRVINIGATYNQKMVYSILQPPTLVVDRMISGYGQERGGIHCTFYNNQPKEPLKIVYFDVIPWYLRLYSHTLQFKQNDKVIKPDFIHYTPGRDRLRPHHLEVGITLPPGSPTHMSLDFDLAFLKWTEYPPDANHGFYVGSAVVTVGVNETARVPGDRPRNVQRIYTQILLVSLPTPDFSMPYNVICLTCTVVALAFGPIHNITTKRLQFVEDEHEETFFSKLKSRFKKWRNSKKVEEKDDSDSSSKKDSDPVESKKDK